MVNSNVFVGREQELTKLHDFLRRAANGQLQICFVTGEAGAGKTTLVNAFVQSLETELRDAVVAFGQCSGIDGKTDAYLPFRDVLAMLTGDIESKPIKNRINEHHARKIGDIGGVSFNVLYELAPDLIGIMIPGSQLLARAAGVVGKESPIFKHLKRRSEQAAASQSEMSNVGICEQYINYLEGVAKKAPLVIVLDDLHWADEASISLLFHISRRAQQSCIFVIATYRQNDVEAGINGEDHPLKKILNEIKGKGTIWIDLTLETEQDQKRFVDKLIDAEPNQLNQAFREKIFSKTEGNALFTCEILQNMKERGEIIRNESGLWVQTSSLDWEGIPPRVEGVIQERIQRLEENIRDALSIGSVQGQTFTAQVIARLQQDIDERRVLGNLSEELEKRHHLIQESGEQKIEDKFLTLYQFSHSLFHQYIYNDLGRGQRRLLHRLVAEALEALYGDQVDDIAHQLARHYEEAGQDKKAVEYLIKVGDKALGIAAFREAQALFAKASQKESVDDSVKMKVQLKLGIAYYELGEYPAAQQCLENAVQLARNCEDRVYLSMSLSRLGRAMADSGDSVSAKPLVSESLDIARKLDEKDILARALNDKGYVLGYLGEPQQARELQEESMRLLQELGGGSIPHSKYDFGCTLFLLGDCQGARVCYQANYDWAVETKNLDVAAYSKTELGWLAFWEKDYSNAESHFEEGLKLAIQSEHKWTIGDAHKGLGYVACALERYSEAHKFLNSALEQTIKGDYLSEQLNVIVGFAYLLRRLGHAERALALFGFVMSYPATDAYITTCANYLMSEIQGIMTDKDFEAGMEKGQGLDLARVSAELLALKVG